ncbi:hypothetical protein Indivirus_2_94 [Indivirus ILV1]|uniref:Uncharacterized protein n=1 Tax=Indivirus ILV1 TaxID=1977633 RepID=A0A1V0SDC2_9VIRU|nr:hypothetical protein Indivirus_2_94 [Indivirus ILV1]
MNWNNPRDNLIHIAENFRDFGHYDKISKSERDIILSENNYTCRYCGGVYAKYLMATYIPHAKMSDASCRMCYIITHLNYGNYHEIKIYYSLMPQLDIVKKSVEYIIENNRIPNPKMIDNNVYLVPISVLEYINIINSCDKQPDELNNYKIFFSERLNVNFILENYGNKMNMFTNDKKEENIFIKKHFPSKKEIELFNKIFRCV